MRKILFSFFIFVIPQSFIFCGQTIAEKKTGLTKVSSELNGEIERYLGQINQESNEIKGQLQQLYATVWQLYQEGACEESYKNLLVNINDLRRRFEILQMEWSEVAVQSSQEESYALWHQPETTLEQLVIDYGSQDYVYLISAEVASIKFSINSNLPVPRALWNDMMELILTQNGVGIRQLNPYLRQLYLLKNNKSALKLITNKRDEIELLPKNTRVCFVLSPEPSEVRRGYLFLEKFINPENTVLQLLGRDIFIIAQTAEIQDLLKLYDFIECNRSDREYRLLTLNRVKAEEMSKILGAIFDQTLERNGYESPGPGQVADLSMSQMSESNGLKVIVLKNMSQALFLVGTKEEIKKAEEIVRNVECQIGEASEKTIFWYAAKHSEPEELADVLQRVYMLMTTSGVRYGSGGPDCPPSISQTQTNITTPPPAPLLPQELYEDEFYQQGGLIVNPRPAEPGIPTPVPANKDRTNFIVDIKTGSIVMVVEAHLLPKMKELLKKLDVPKKMVQIETLLIERKICHRNDFGLNLLRIGSHASQTRNTGLSFNDPTCDKQRGIFEFLLSRVCGSGIPAFDITYRFLLSQDEVQINAAPSILTINQTPATIQIVEEISLNTGIFDVETAKGNTLKDSFTRAQYGITMIITPTVHMRDETYDGDDDVTNFITLDADINFDTFDRGDHPDRPNVTRRHLTNQTRIPDGQTVIIAGLKRKSINDGKRNDIPFLGELPGVGKFFGFTGMQDSSTEMFIFMTPKIIADPEDDLLCLRQEELCRRPGDVPEFLLCLEEAKQAEKCRLFEGTLTAIFGRNGEQCYYSDEVEGEYDGR